jgi:hypothetical protein
MKIGEGFKDDMGFVRRTGVTRQFYDVAFLPQPEALRSADRQLQPPTRACGIYDDPRAAWCAAPATSPTRRPWKRTARFMEYAFEPRVDSITGRS